MMPASIRVLAGACVLFLVGCSRDVPVAEVAAGVAPLSELSGVWLGMRGDELVRARPAAQVSGYYGYEEAVSGWDVAYHVPGSMDDHQAPPDGSHLDSVIASDSLAETPDPALQWEAKVRAVAGIAGTDPMCYQLRWPTTTAWMAVWRRGSGDLFVLGQPAGRDPTGKVTPPGLRVGVVRRGQALSRMYTHSTKADCATAARADSITLHPRSE